MNYILPSKKNTLIKKSDSLNFVAFDLSDVLLSQHQALIPFVIAPRNKITKLTVDAFTSIIKKCIKKLNEHNLKDDDNIQMLQNLDVDYKNMTQMIV